MSIRTQVENQRRHDAFAALQEFVRMRETHALSYALKMYCILTGEDRQTVIDSLNDSMES